MMAGGLAVCSVLALTLGVQASQASQSLRGTSVLAGRVVTMDPAGQLVPNAIVTLSAPELPQGKSTVTDDSGRFVFANLPAGRFTITASKAAHITTAYGAKRPGRPGTSVLLAAGQQVTDLTVRLARVAVITGRVTDRAGQSVSMVQVTAIPADATYAPSTSSFSTETFLTDDRGVYRVFGLEPGAYLVAVIPRAAGAGAGDAEVMSSSAVDTALAALRARGSSGTAAPSAPTAAPTARSALDSSLLPVTFYPGTVRSADAVRVTLAIGEERSGADIVLERVPASTIEGAVTAPDGSTPTNLSLRLMANGPSVTGKPGPQLLANRSPDADGRFRIPGVSPGEYTLTIISAGGTQLGGVPRGPQYATEAITAVGGVYRVALALRPMPSFAGKMVFAGATIAPPADLTLLRVTLAPPAQPASASGVGSAGTLTAIVSADGTFQIPDVTPGSYRVVASSVTGNLAGSGWWLRSAIAGGRDVLDTLLDVGSAGIDGAVLTFTDRHTTLSGRLQSAANDPVSNCFIVAFSTDRAVWKPFARRVQSARPGTDGLFTFPDLPAGEYFMAALNDVDQDEWRDPAFLADIAAGGAVRVVLTDGGNKVQNLQLAR